MELLIDYANYRGGINNLQIVKVVEPSPFSGLVSIIKTFTSTKGLAIKRAENYIINLERS